MTIITTREPVGEPLSLAEAKAHLRIEHTAEDDCILGLIRVARDHLERTTGLCLITRTLRLALQAPCEEGLIRLLRGPVQTIDRITLYDGQGTASTLPVQGLVFEREGPPARLFMPRGFDPARAENGIEVDFTAGFGPAGADVPDSLRRALLLHVAVMFEYRGAVSLADQPAALPAGYERLVAPFLAPGL